MSSFGWILSGAVICAAGYFFYQYGKKKKPSDFLNKIKGIGKPEEIDSLAMTDVVNYFKSLQLKKGRDIPFICDFRRITVPRSDLPSVGYLLATYNEDADIVENCRFLLPKHIDPSVSEVLKDNGLVVLS